MHRLKFYTLITQTNHNKRIPAFPFNL